MTYGEEEEARQKRYKANAKLSLKITGVALVVGLVVIALGVGIWTITRGISRSQALKNANNSVKISAIEIRNQQQRVEIAKQKAEIRLQDAIGVRESQDEIAKTLTPLYVQYEMTQVLLEVARSGRNNSIVYLPGGAGGVPLVATVPNDRVGVGDSGGK